MAPPTLPVSLTTAACTPGAKVATEDSDTMTMKHNTNLSRLDTPINVYTCIYILWAVLCCVDRCVFIHTGSTCTCIFLLCAKCRFVPSMDAQTLDSHFCATNLCIKGVHTGCFVCVCVHACVCYR